MATSLMLSGPRSSSSSSASPTASPSVSLNNASTAPSPGTASPVVQFTTIKMLFETIDHTTGDILTVQGVSVLKFAEIEKERTKCRRKFRFRRYLAQSEILIISIPTAIHEELHLHIYRKIDRQILGMGLEDDWRSMGSVTLRATRGHPGGDGGEGDSTGGPELQRPGGLDWPTLVIEAGDSEELEELRKDMRWWFGTSDHQVKIVLLAKFDRGQRDIILEKWVEVPARARQGATTTRAAAKLEPSCSQVITITQNPGITDTDPNRLDPASYTVTRGALRLEFDSLFLRQPGQGEGDVVVSIPDLQKYAVRVWQRVVVKQG